MKHFTIFVSILLFSACGLTKNNSATAQNNATPSETVSSKNDVIIAYSAITRGSFLEITIKNQILLVTKEQHGSAKTSDLSKSEWDHLLNELETINLDSLSVLKAPSMKRSYDGAASARLQITEANLVYSTTEFDHGNPNSKIKPLVEYILSLAKKVD